MLLILGVHPRAVQYFMGWSTDQAKRYQHIVESLKREIADQIGAILWEPAAPKHDPDALAPSRNAHDSDGSSVRAIE